MDKKTLPRVSIVILNWNNYIDTVECLISLMDITYQNAEIIVVDNGSTDGSYQKLLADNNGCRIIRNEKNIGFAAGNNVGIKEAMNNDSDYILMLNNDTIVKKDFLEPMVSFLEDNIDVGVVGGKIYYYSDPDIIWTIGGDVKLFRGGSIYYGNRETDIGQYDGIKELTHISGCMSMIRKEVIEAVGCLSEQYFFRGEEWDYCYRVRKRGYKMFYIPTSVIWHKVSRTVSRFSPFDIYCAYRAKIIFINNFMPKPLNYIWIVLFHIYARFYSVKKFSAIAKKRSNKDIDIKVLKKVILMVFEDSKKEDKITLDAIDRVKRLVNE
jgi:GT2 family glycosyltransferase